MGWLKRILHGSTSNSGQRSNGSCEVDDRRSCSDEPNDTEDESTYEEEETDYQIARIPSFLEDGQAYSLYGAALTEGSVQYEELKWEDEDERPAQSFQQSLAFESSSPWDIANIFQPFPFSFYHDDGQSFPHTECVHSYASDGSLTDHEIFVSEDDSINQYIDNDHDLHHRHHHHHHRGRPLCCVCWQPIPLDASGRLLSNRSSFWGQKYCLSHETDGTPRCEGCQRLEPRESTYSTLSDGRRLCAECRVSTIMDVRALKALEPEIREFYERLGMKVHQRRIALHLVNRHQMKEFQARKEKNAYHEPNHTIGLTKSDVQPICTTVEGRQHTLVAHSRIVSIRVLDGFPRLYTGSILAHEMMHAWHRLEGSTLDQDVVFNSNFALNMLKKSTSRFKGYHQWNDEVKEGLCQVLAHMWLDSQLRSMSKSKMAPSPQFNYEKRLAKFLQNDIESRTDSPYGTGFRLMKTAMDMYGLKGTIDYIRMTGSYP